jgi:uncharacterized protein YdgA (DUF945 family)
VHAFAEDETTRVLESTFERGWLRSRAETSVEMSGGAGLAFRAFVTALDAVDVRERVGVHMVHSIEHGPLPLVDWIRDGIAGPPVLARIRSTVEIDYEAQLELAEAIGKLPALEADTVVRLFGQATSRLSIPPQRLVAKTEGFGSDIQVQREGQFHGAHGQLAFHDRYRHVRGTLESPGFAGRGRERAVELRDVTWLFELPGSELPVGRMEVAFASLRVSPVEGAGGFALEDVLIEPSGRVAGGRLEADLAARARGLFVGTDASGPATLSLQLRDVDTTALRRVRRAGQTLQQGQGDPAATAVAASQLVEALPALLERAPRAELRELRIATPAGAVAARGRASIARPDLAAGSLSLASFFDAELEAEAPVAWAESVLAAALEPAQLSQLRAQGSLGGERTALRAEWRGGALQLNGVGVAGAAATAGAPAVPSKQAAPRSARGRAAEAAPGRPAASAAAADAAPSASAVPSEPAEAQPTQAEAPPSSASPESGQTAGASASTPNEGDPAGTAPAQAAEPARADAPQPPSNPEPPAEARAWGSPAAASEAQPSQLPAAQPVPAAPAP